MGALPRPDSSDPESDPRLMRSVARGNPEAFAELVRRHQKSLVNFFARLGVYQDAEDLAQETFVRLFKYRKKYRHKAKFTTFLYLLARQVRIDHIRKQERIRQGSAAHAEEYSILQQPSSGSDMTGVSLDIERALGILPDEMRAVVVLNIYQGLRYRDIADVMKIPIGTVKSRMFNALGRLREVMSE